MTEVIARLAHLRMVLPSPFVRTDSVEPLFVVGEGDKTAREELLSRLRLSGVPDDVDSQSTIDEAINKARLGFVRHLGWARVKYLQSIPYQTASDDDTWLRELAIQTEVDWVRNHLRRLLSSMFMDGGGRAQSMWNQEGAFRETGSRELNDEIRRTETEIIQNIELLSGEESAGNETDIEVSVIEPDSPPAMGGTIWPNLRR